MHVAQQRNVAAERFQAITKMNIVLSFIFFFAGNAPMAPGKQVADWKFDVF